MGNQVWRPEQLPEERTARALRNLFPTGLDGLSPNTVPVLGTTSEQAASVKGVSAAGGAAVTPQWNNQSLVITTAPTSWTLDFVPILDSIDLYLNGAGLVNGVDYTQDDKFITFLSPSLFTGLVSGDPWTLLAQYQYFDTITPDTVTDIFANYSAPGCPASDNYFGSDGKFGMPVGTTRYVITGYVFGAGGPQTLTVDKLVYDDENLYGYWKTPDGCIMVRQISTGEGFPYTGSTQTANLPVGAPVGTVLVRIINTSTSGFGVSTITFDAGEL